MFFVLDQLEMCVVVVVVLLLLDLDMDFGFWLLALGLVCRGWPLILVSFLFESESRFIQSSQCEGQNE